MSIEDWLANVREALHGPKPNEPWVEMRHENCGDIHEFVGFVEKLANMPRLSPENAGFLFRGQADNSWSLRPSLWRHFESPESAIRLEDVLSIEFDSISFFKARAHLHANPPFIPHDDDLGAWLTLMQHYRAPTRMLDWTTSLSVALYCAAADYESEVLEMGPDQQWTKQRKSQPGAVWFFEPRSLLASMKDNRGYVPHSKERYAQICASKESFVAFGLGEARPIVWPYLPGVPTDRMLAQKGILTFSEQPLCDHAKLIGEALLDHRKERPDISPLIKLVIPAAAKAALREYLIRIDIHASTLFPGLDGIGNTISEMIGLEIKTYLRELPTRQASGPQGGTQYKAQG